jgi:2-polyprenyl-3-methyl-5-hydroxy-6-metoxy-1,4-benzoquinol methylase
VRDYNAEHKDVGQRKYAYDFDWIIRKYLLKAISPYFNNSVNALELGCFQGDMTAQLLEYFERLTVVEASSDLCQHVAKRFPEKIKVINSTFENADLDAVYDSIFLVHTLEHLDNPIEILSRIKKWLAPDGRLFVAVPNATALSRQVAVCMGLIDYASAVTPAEKEHGHRITYTMDIFKHHLKRAVFHIITTGGILIKPFANFQFDKALDAGIIDDAYLDGCHELGKMYPDLCASLFAVCEAKDTNKGLRR